MKSRIMLIAVTAFLLSACTINSGDIEVHNAWARPTAQGENAAVYFQIHNHSDIADELLSVSTNVADAAEIHESKMENDVMHMSMMPSLTLNTGDDLLFEPGGLHVMLVNINKEFVLGEHIGITLHFANHADIVVNVHVENAAPEEDHDH